MSESSLYRHTSVGDALSAALDDLIQTQKITPNFSKDIFKQFDKEIFRVLDKQAKSRITFKGKVKEYRNIDSVWTFTCGNVHFAVGGEDVPADQLRITACQTAQPRP
eukprot:m.174868 g.174868  ORF g.174868 m.174868 type:complete len:107 (+) comp53311_c0_seq1:197-517(+)